MQSTDFNILIGDGIQETDKNLFFGPLTQDDQFIVFSSSTRFPQLLKALGIFSSTSQVRKSSWNKDIDEGWTEIPKIGKLRHRICILKVLS